MTGLTMDNGQTSLSEDYYATVMTCGRKCIASRKMSGVFAMLNVDFYLTS